VAAILKVHRSNFRMSGFTEEASLPELAALSRAAGLPLLHDLGSGLFADPAQLGLSSEPRARDSLAGGADLVVVSGDKLLGGPQAGLAMGQESVVNAMRHNPLCRALRVDKVTLAGLEATLRLYRNPRRAFAEIPTLRMLRERPEALRERAEDLAARLATVGVVGCGVEAHAGAVGGGTYPEVVLASWAVALPGSAGADALAGLLRRGDPPVVGRIEGDRVLLDVRTIAREEEDALVRCVRVAWEATGS
jgi:L-seryl-tRNA(Ser) seleniumtransferase